MISKFLADDFLLETKTAQELFEKYAAPMPIIDYHNHLSPKEIATNRRYRNLTEIWLEGDHYKWRAMRINGVDERFITGNASAEEKFKKWSETVPYTLRNPLYHWTHLELKRYFGISDLLDGNTGDHIYSRCSTLLSQNDFTNNSLLMKMNVHVLCTTDDPADSLEHHLQLSKEKKGFRMYPTFRPDKAIAIEDPVAYGEYLVALGLAAGVNIQTYEDLLEALSLRINFFHNAGCRISDHGLEHLCHVPQAEAGVDAIFKKLKSGKSPDANEVKKFRCAVLTSLGKLYFRKGWTQQYHLGALRNNNDRLKRLLGADAGFDSMGDFPQAYHLSKFLNELDSTNELTKTIIYNNNPADNEVFATMIGNFSDGSIAGKIQYGSGWWFLDQKDGIERQLNALSNMGLLSRFIGMVTDSRSMLSFPRHEYFRRILCNLFGNDIEKGLLPNDLPHIGKIVSGICYQNAKTYLGF
jgi:glucuronate isomerase